MDTDRWARVDDYLGRALMPQDAHLAAAVAASEAAGLPAIQVTATQGRLLEILARMLSARRILEIGTLGGYSTLWLARGLAPGGGVMTLESDPRHAGGARATVPAAGLPDRIPLRPAPANDTLPPLP